MHVYTRTKICLTLCLCIYIYMLSCRLTTLDESVLVLHGDVLDMCLIGLLRPMHLPVYSIHLGPRGTRGVRIYVL